MDYSQKIGIIFYPLTGGVFLARILSCSKSLYGQTFIEKLKKDYNINNIIKQDSNRYHEIFYPLHPRLLNFSEFEKFKKIIVINYTSSKIEKEIIEFRKKFIKSSLNLSDEYSDLQLKYQQELINYFHEKNINICNIEFSSFMKSNYFSLEIDKICDFLNFEKIPKQELLECHNYWWKINLKLNHAFNNKQYDGSLVACDFE